MKTIKFISILIIIAIISSMLSGCGGSAESKDLEKEKVTAIPVEVSIVKTGSISAVFSGTANLEAENEATVVAKVSGVIERIKVEEGDYVKKGQILAKLD
ncbi:MAG: biotin/lipoyl-binding protein, partial [Calditrichia bacterium]|nr:biotin/lipoyl-binding protein [Calditrichia bacterium]